MLHSNRTAVLYLWNASISTFDGWLDINTLKLISSSSSSGILFSKVDTK